MRGLYKGVSVIIVALLLIYVVLYNPNLNRRSSSLLKEWRNCMLANAEVFKGRYEEAWNTGWEQAITICEQEILAHFNISQFNNKDEVKHHLLPKTKSLSTVVTLGIGKDIQAEKDLQKVLGKENVEFFGADPIYDQNDQLYTEIGKFFPVAISSTAGYSMASVYINDVYVNKPVVNVDMIYFLTNMVNRTFYDAIWLDAEHAEYGLFPFILEGGLLDQNGITVCQWNMEIHQPDSVKKRLTHDFLFQTIRDQRYWISKQLYISGHYRLYFLNFEDERCLEKYFPSDLLLV